jgi:hypothetical protein
MCRHNETVSKLIVARESCCVGWPGGHCLRVPKEREGMFCRYSTLPKTTDDLCRRREIISCRSATRTRWRPGHPTQMTPRYHDFHPIHRFETVSRGRHLPVSKERHSLSDITLKNGCKLNHSVAPGSSPLKGETPYTSMAMVSARGKSRTSGRRGRYSAVHRKDSWISLTEVSGGNPPLNSSSRLVITLSPERPSAIISMLRPCWRANS